MTPKSATLSEVELTPPGGIATHPRAEIPPRVAVDVSVLTKIGMDRAMQAHIAAKRAARVTPVGFDYPTTLQGSTANFNVYYETGFANGPAIAAGVLATCDNDYAYLVNTFGYAAPNLPMNIIIAPGIGGAYHYGCAGTDLYCDGDTSPSPDIDHTRFLAVAEEVELFEAAAGTGWDCGASPGEGLSRVLATELYPAELDGFTSASTWLNTPGRPDFVTTSDPTDTNYVSIGCSTLFLNYLRYQLDYTWTEIINATGATLEATYEGLTGVVGGYTPFADLLQQFFPEGTPVNLPNDNPFPLVGSLQFPFCGVQFRTSLQPSETQLWFTYNWPVLWSTMWQVVPTNVGGPQGQVQSSVAIQKGQGGNLTYWITITNVSGAPVDCEARYTVLCS